MHIEKNLKNTYIKKKGKNNMPHFFNKKVFFTRKKIYIFLFIILLSITIYFLNKTFIISSEKNTIHSPHFSNYQTIIKNINIKKPYTLLKAHTFLQQNKNIYGTLTAMFLAKEYILNKKLEKALAELNYSLQYTKDENLKNLLLLKISKIQIEKKDNIQAQKTINKISNNNWKNITENVKGDIFFECHQNQEAIKAWQKSQNIEESDTFKQIIKIKINDIKRT